MIGRSSRLSSVLANETERPKEQLPRREMLMTAKKQTSKKSGKNQKESSQLCTAPGPTQSRAKRFSHAEAEIDTGKHLKNPDWKKKWWSRASPVNCPAAVAWVQRIYRIVTLAGRSSA